VRFKKSPAKQKTTDQHLYVRRHLTRLILLQTFWPFYTRLFPAHRRQGENRLLFQLFYFCVDEYFYHRCTLQETALLNGICGRMGRQLRSRKCREKFVRHGFQRVRTTWPAVAGAAVRERSGCRSELCRTAFSFLSCVGCSVYLNFMPSVHNKI
jgi:hypothetical protein